MDLDNPVPTVFPEIDFSKKEDIVSQSCLKNSYQTNYNSFNNIDENLGQEFFGREPKYEEDVEKTFEKEKVFDVENEFEQTDDKHNLEQSNNTEIYSYKDEEINAVCDFIRNQAGPDYFFNHDKLQQNADAQMRKDNTDELFNDVARYVVEMPYAPTFSHILT